jgi:uncharacterized protein YegP (UPF0339 family)
MGVPHFDVMYGPTNQIQFKLIDSAGSVVVSSGGYPNKDACFKAIRSMKENARVDQRYEKRTLEGKFFFTFKAASHEVLAKGGPYDSEAARDEALAVIRKSIEAAVMDKT